MFLVCKQLRDDPTGKIAKYSLASNFRHLKWKKKEEKSYLALAKQDNSPNLSVQTPVTKYLQFLSNHRKTLCVIFYQFQCNNVSYDWDLSFKYFNKKTSQPVFRMFWLSEEFKSVALVSKNLPNKIYSHHFHSGGQMIFLSVLPH